MVQETLYLTVAVFVNRHSTVTQFLRPTVTHLSREIFGVVGGDIENAPEQLGDIERSVASPADNDAPLPV